MVQFVDWELAATTAGTLSKAGPKVSYAEAAGVVAQLRELTGVAEGHVERFTELRPTVDHPPVRVVDRPDWAAANVAGLNAVFTPLVARLTEGREPGPLAQAIGSRIAGVQAGSVLAYLSGKVLGQYEVFSSDPGHLLLVAPNIVEVERKLEARPRDFRLWVCLHEVTHRTQFTAVPWMRQHLFDEVAAFVNATQLDSDQLADRVRRAIEAIAGSVRDPRRQFNVLDLVQTPAQRAVLDRLTAMMTLLEGHAEYVMDGVGPTVVPTVDEIRAKFNQRRESASPIERVVRKLLGIDVKLRQYAEGRKFVHAVVDRVGVAAFNRVWESPQTLPLVSELSDPDAWIARVIGSTPQSGGTGTATPGAVPPEDTQEPPPPPTGTATPDAPPPAAGAEETPSPGKAAPKRTPRAARKPAGPPDARTRRPGSRRTAADPSGGPGGPAGPTQPPAAGPPPAGPSAEPPRAQPPRAAEPPTTEPPTTEPPTTEPPTEPPAARPPDPDVPDAREG